MVLGRRATAGVELKGLDVRFEQDSENLEIPLCGVDFNIKCEARTKSRGIMRISVIRDVKATVFEFDTRLGESPSGLILSRDSVRVRTYQNSEEGGS